MPKNDGGAAFPRVFQYTAHNEEGAKAMVSVEHAGMTLRDWFAGEADEAWNIYMFLYADEPMDSMEGIAKSISEIRGTIADAMLKEREK